MGKNNMVMQSVKQHESVTYSQGSVKSHLNQSILNETWIQQGEALSKSMILVASTGSNGGTWFSTKAAHWDTKGDGTIWVCLGSQTETYRRNPQNSQNKIYERYNPSNKPCPHLKICAAERKPKPLELANNDQRWHWCTGVDRMVQWKWQI